MRLPRILAPVSALALVAGGAVLAAPPTSAAPTAPFQEYVALGDSWSADVVIADTDGLPASEHAPIDCAQSHRNYPKLVAQTLGVPTFRDATCGSATTDDFYKPQTGLPLGGTNPAQFDRLTPTTDLVTVGIGGNDAGFAGAAIGCINALPFNTGIFAALPALPFSIPMLGSSLPLGGCHQLHVKDGRDHLAERVAASESKLIAALREIHRRSPRARVLMLNYLDAIPAKGCYPMVPVSNEDMAYLHGIFAQLNAMVARAAARGGAELVDAFGASSGHDVCQMPNKRYVEGLGIVSVNGLAVAVPAHPNSAGAAQQYRSVMAQLAKPAPATVSAIAAASAGTKLLYPRWCAKATVKAKKMVHKAHGKKAKKKARAKGKKLVKRACVRV